MNQQKNFSHILRKGTSLLNFESAEWAYVISYNYYIITARLENSRITIKVHSPGTSMSGSFKPDTLILVQPYSDIKPARKCGYYVLALKSETGFMGANPSLGNLIFESFLNKQNSFFDLDSYKQEVTLEDNRFDFLLNLRNKEPRYLEVKSCFFIYNNSCFFPLKHLSDLPKLHKIPKNYKPMSPRALKHLQSLNEIGGILVFVAHCSKFNNFQINPRQIELTNRYSKLKEKFLLKVTWKEDKTVRFHSFKRLK